MLSAKRTRVHLSTFVSLLVTVGIVSGLGAGLVGYLQDAATQGVRASLAEHTGADRALRIGQPLAPGAARQDRAVLGFVHREFSTAQRAIPIASFRTLSVDIPYQGRIPSASDPRLVTVASIPDLEGWARLVAGSWPTGDGDAAIQADAASRLGLGVGDRIRVGATDLRIAATWRAAHPLDPRWLGDPLMASGVDPTSFGPVVVAEQAWQRIGQQPWVYWTLVPDATAITAHELDTILDQWPGFANDILPVDTGATGLSQDGDFLVTASVLQDRIHAVDALTPMVPLTLAAIALVAILELARLLTELRSSETELLWSRGATPGGLAASTAVEAAITSALGALLGVGAADLALRLSGHPDAPAAAGAAAWIIPVTSAVVATVVFGVQALRASRLDARRDAPERSGRGGLLAGLGLVVLVLAATSVSVWQLQLYGSPVTPVSGGGSQVDPLTVFAPSATLVSVVLIGLLLFSPIAVIAERFLSRRRPAGLVLAVRSIARRRALVATPLVIVGLAVGQFATAGGYGASWATSFAQAHDLRAGTAVRIDAPAGLTESQLHRVGGLPGVTGVAPIAVDEHNVAGEAFTLVGIAPGVLAAAGTRAGGAIDSRAMAKAIDTRVGFPSLSASGGSLEIALTLNGFSAAPRIRAWVSDADGLLLPIDLSVRSGHDGARAVGPLPTAGSGPWRLAAIDVSPAADEAPAGRTGRTLGITSISAGGTAFPIPAGWDVFEAGGDPQPSEATDVRFDVPIVDEAVTRLMPPIPRAPTRVVMSTALAKRIGGSTGMLLPVILNLAAPPVTTSVAAIAPGIPGSPAESAMLVDLSVVQAFDLHSLSTPDTVATYWVVTGHPDRVGAAIRRALPGDIAVSWPASDPDRVMLGSAAVALWITAVSAGILAIAAIGAVIAAQLRGRRSEVAVLRALGTRNRQQAAIRSRELAIVIGYAVVFGLVAGAIAVLVTITAFARVAVPDSFASLPTAPLFDPIALPIALLAFVGLLACAVLVSGALVARQARGGIVREEDP